MCWPLNATCLFVIPDCEKRKKHASWRERAVMSDPLSPKSPRKGKIVNIRILFLDDTLHAFQVPVSFFDLRKQNLSSNLIVHTQIYAICSEICLIDFWIVSNHTIHFLISLFLRIYECLLLYCYGKDFLWISLTILKCWWMLFPEVNSFWQFGLN